jgi:hypothetical protein
MNPPPSSLFARTAPFHPPRVAAPAAVMAHHAAVSQPPHPPAQVVMHPAPPPASPGLRGEGDVQWIVGWIRDLLVIAMAIANLLHSSGGH